MTHDKQQSTKQGNVTKLSLALTPTSLRTIARTWNLTPSSRDLPQFHLLIQPYLMLLCHSLGIMVIHEVPTEQLQEPFLLGPTSILHVIRPCLMLLCHSMEIKVIHEEPTEQSEEPRT